MSTRNICFHEEIRKIYLSDTHLISRPMGDNFLLHKNVSYGHLLEGVPITTFLLVNEEGEE